VHVFILRLQVSKFAHCLFADLAEGKEKKGPSMNPGRAALFIPSNYGEVLAKFSNLSVLPSAIALPLSLQGRNRPYRIARSDK
jgi:hypothetical protein